MKVRRQVRIPTTFNAQIRPIDEDEKEKKQLTIRNISAGGVFIESAQPFPPETLLEMSFCLPEFQQEIQAVGFVRWARDNITPQGMGIQFLSLSTEAQKAIRLFMEKSLNNKDDFSMSGFF